VLARAPDPVTSVLVGKWHLNVRGVGSAELQPGHAGFAWWRGTNGNLTSHFLREDGGFGYWHWERNDDGALSVDTTYATEALVADAIDALGALEPPWFLYVPLHAAHDPLHVPPEGWTYSTPSADPTGYEKASLMIESTDIAVGRILDAMTEEQRATTTVVFLSDNGSLFTVPGEPWGFFTSKGSPYEGGVNVPFWVSGPLVTEPGATSDALVQTSDLFDTALALAGVLPAETDALVGEAPRRRYSESFLPFLRDPHRATIRQFAYTEKFQRNGPPPWPVHEYAIRDDRYVLVIRDRPTAFVEELYDLRLDPYESADLLAGDPSPEQQAAFDRLSAELARLDGELVFEY
jgi:arylsulfatase A-like enzyme